MDGAKYDRQLRLWSLAGQQSLAEAHVVVLGATATAAEMIKNLILPGVGFFTIVDDAVVDDDAMGNNFFVSANDYAARRPLAQALQEHLGQLNTQSSVVASVQSCAAWVEAFVLSEMSSCGGGAANPEQKQGQQKSPRPSFIIITPKLPAASVRRLSAHVRARNDGQPLMYVQTSGLAGLIHVQEKERFIIYAEPKPDTCVEDLRIFNPFPELKQWFHVHNPEDDALFRDDIELHSHLPWIAILYHALQRVKQERGVTDFMPRSKADYDDIRRAVNGLIRRTNPPQEGFMEALDKCRVVLNRPFNLPSELQTIMEDPRADGQGVSAESSDNYSQVCWSVVHGIKRFTKEHNGVLPFCGHVPDFTTTTQWYGELRGIYEKKMRDDSAAVSEYAMEAIRGRAGGPGAGKSVPDADEVSALTRALIQNLWTLQLVTFQPDLDEMITKELQWKSIGQCFDVCDTDEERFTVELYAALLASRVFEEKHGRAPGLVLDSSEDQESTWVSDSNELLRIIADTRQGFSNTTDLTAKACMEIARSGAGEPAITACIVGAAAAQECIKLLQHRRVPIQRPLVFDGYRNCFWLVPRPPEEEVEK